MTISISHATVDDVPAVVASSAALFAEDDGAQRFYRRHGFAPKSVWFETGL